MPQKDSIKRYENSSINWYPGHMAAAKRMMEENLKLVDIIIEVRDARIPFSSANPDISKFQKLRVILLNKADLADDKKTELWREKFTADGITAIPLCAKNKNNTVVRTVNEVLETKNEYFKAKGINRNMRALVAGIPNCGKSTVINTVCGQARAKTGDKAGVTRGKQWIKTKYVDLLDTPGILWPKLDDRLSAEYLAFTGALNDEVLDLEELSLKLIKTLTEKYPESLENRYGISLTGNNIGDLEAICKKRGFILRGNEFDYTRCARVLFDEFRSGILGKITLEVP